MFQRIGAFILVAGAGIGCYAGCERDEQASTPKSFRDAVEVKLCSDNVRYFVRCVDGTTEYRTYDDIQTDNLCLSKTLLTVTEPSGTFLGRIQTGTNCSMSYNQQVMLKQPPTMISAAQAVVLPLEGALPGCNITAGVVLRADVEFSTPSYPSYPSLPGAASYPCN